MCFVKNYLKYLINFQRFQRKNLILSFRHSFTRRIAFQSVDHESRGTLYIYVHLFHVGNSTLIEVENSLFLAISQRKETRNFMFYDYTFGTTLVLKIIWIEI